MKHNFQPMSHSESGSVTCGFLYRFTDTTGAFCGESPDHPDHTSEPEKPAMSDRYHQNSYRETLDRIVRDKLILEQERDSLKARLAALTKDNMTCVEMHKATDEGDFKGWTVVYIVGTRAQAVFRDEEDAIIWAQSQPYIRAKWQVR